MLDRLALIEAAPSRFAADLVPTMAVVQTCLADDLDAVSDIIMAKAVHHRAMGAVEGANARLSVLWGGRLPGRSSFLRMQRPGHAASHRVALNLQTDLGLCPFELLIGGQSEIEMRDRAFVVEAWCSGP